MNPHTQPTGAGLAAGLGIVSMLGLSVVFSALASPAALAIGAAAGFAIAYRDRFPLESRSFRIGLVILALASAAFIWLSVQPGYIGI